jgi:hypothetical protein
MLGSDNISGYELVQIFYISVNAIKNRREKSFHASNLVSLSDFESCYSNKKSTELATSFYNTCLFYFENTVITPKCLKKSLRPALVWSAPGQWLRFQGAITLS